MNFREFADGAARVFELVGVVVLLIGGVVTIVRWLQRVTRHESGREQYLGARRDFGRSVLLGLEILVAGDIIRTVAVEPTLDSVVVLAVIVLVRVVLSFALDAEIEGRFPWQQPVPVSPPSGPAAQG